MLKKLFLNFFVFGFLEIITPFPLKSLRLLDEAKNVELTFVKIYELFYINYRWNFKILVEGDEDLSDGTILGIDVRFLYIVDDAGNTYFVVYCTFQKINHILNCFNTFSSYRLFKFVQNKYCRFLIYPKEFGNVTWRNGYERDVSIPFNHTFTYNSAYGAFFTDKWNFLISVKNTGESPKYSKIIIDIIHNTKRPTAT